MIETNERPAYVYGEILSRPVDTRDEQPGLGTLVSQGAIVGAFIGFACLANGLLSHPENGYNFLLLFFLLPFVLGGMTFGAFEGSIIWVCTYFVPHRLNFALRVCIGLVVHSALCAFVQFVLDRSANSEPVPTEYVVFYVVFGLAFGLVVGSRFEPWVELFRGSTSTPWRCVTTGLTGVALRVVVIFAFMQSVLNLIWQQQRNETSSEQTIALIAVIHFVAAAVIVFARMRTWLLVQFALLVNVPIVVFMTDVLTGNDAAMRTLSIIYLTVWFLFLVTRLIGTSPSGENSVTT